MGKCYFSNLDAKISDLTDGDGVSVIVSGFVDYRITSEAVGSYMEEHSLSEKVKLLCLQESIKLNSEGLIALWTVQNQENQTSKNYKIVNRSIEDFKKRNVDHKDKDIKIIQLLGNKLSSKINPFEYVGISLRERYLIGIFDKTEFFKRIEYLFIEKLILLSVEAELRIKERRFTDLIISTLEQESITLSVKGWDLVHSMNNTQFSKNVFIAMAFTDNNKIKIPADLRDTIKKAIEECGWKPIIVDEVHYNDGVVDRIISLINESKFIIAELTHHKQGVYYEAGYAKGRNLPVIHLVNENDLNNSHFDIKHLNLVVWKTHEDLLTKLKNRIKATII